MKKLSQECEEEKELLKEMEKKKIKVSLGKEGEKFLAEQFRKLALDLKWVKNSGELNKILASVSVLQTRGLLQKEKKDRILMAAIGSLDETDKTLNVFSERLREWYGLHFPELGKLTPDHKTFAIQVCGHKQ